jgi:hypothetical protein
MNLKRNRLLTRAAAGAVFSLSLVLVPATAMAQQAQPRQQNNCVEVLRKRVDNNYCSGRPALIVEFRNRCESGILYKLCTQHAGGWTCGSGMLGSGEETSNGIEECGRYNGEVKYWGFLEEPGVNMFNYLPRDPQ